MKVASMNDLVTCIQQHSQTVTRTELAKYGVRHSWTLAGVTVVEGRKGEGEVLWTKVSIGQAMVTLKLSGGDWDGNQYRVLGLARARLPLGPIPAGLQPSA